MENSPGKWKKGDIHPETGRVFWQYRRYYKRHTKEKELIWKEYWMSEVQYTRKINEYREYIQSEEVRERQRQRNWHGKNKERAKVIAKRTKDRQKINNPLLLLYKGLYGGAKIRNKIIEIVKDDLEQLWIKQEGKCYYTNIPMEYTYGSRSPYQVSADRVDSNEGYTIENTVLCCQSINFAKKDYGVDIFKKFLKDIKENIR